MRDASTSIVDVSSTVDTSSSTMRDGSTSIVDVPSPIVDTPSSTMRDTMRDASTSIVDVSSTVYTPSSTMRDGSTSIVDVPSPIVDTPSSTMRDTMRDASTSIVDVSSTVDTSSSNMRERDASTSVVDASSTVDTSSSTMRDASTSTCVHPSLTSRHNVVNCPVCEDAFRDKVQLTENDIIIRWEVSYIMYEYGVCIKDDQPAPMNVYTAESIARVLKFHQKEHILLHTHINSFKDIDVPLWKAGGYDVRTFLHRVPMSSINATLPLKTTSTALSSSTVSNVNVFSQNDLPTEEAISSMTGVTAESWLRKLGRAVPSLAAEKVDHLLTAVRLAKKTGFISTTGVPSAEELASYGQRVNDAYTIIHANKGNFISMKNALPHQQFPDSDSNVLALVTEYQQKFSLFGSAIEQTQHDRFCDHAEVYFEDPFICPNTGLTFQNVYSLNKVARSVGTGKVRSVFVHYRYQIIEKTILSKKVLVRDLLALDPICLAPDGVLDTRGTTITALKTAETKVCFNKQGNCGHTLSAITFNLLEGGINGSSTIGPCQWSERSTSNKLAKNINPVEHFFEPEQFSRLEFNPTKQSKRDELEKGLSSRVYLKALIR